MQERFTSSILVRRPTVVAVVFVVWCAATWLLEGRIQSGLRPDALSERVAYVVVANILVGILAVVVALRRSTPLGFGRGLPSLPWIVVGVVLGIAMYFGQGAPSRDPIVVLNAYAQVLVVSIAEVMVCWVLIGNLLLEAAGGPRWLRTGAAIIGAALLFGLYHFAHSPPFNTPRMVVLLAAIGLLTGAFFFVSRDTYATILFHNFLGVFGVVRALAAADRLRSFETMQTPVIALAAVAMVTLIASHRLFLRPSPPTELTSIGKTRA